MRRTILTAIATAAVLLTGCGGDRDDPVPSVAVDSVDEDGFTRGQRADIARLTGLRDYYAKKVDKDGYTRGQRADIARLTGLRAYYAKKDDEDGPLTITEGVDEPEDDVGTRGSQ